MQAEERDLDRLIKISETCLALLLEDSDVDNSLCMRVSDLQRFCPSEAKIVIQAPPLTKLGAHMCLEITQRECLPPPNPFIFHACLLIYGCFCLVFVILLVCVDIPAPSEESGSLR